MEEIEVLITSEAGHIDCNFDDMKAYLYANLEEYRTAVFTDESIKPAKTIVADLRKQQKAFKDRIQKVKKEYMTPFDEFKAKADELVALYDEPINFIDGQIKDYTARQKAQKKELITAMYKEVFGELADLVPLEKIYDLRWENVTYKRSDIINELSAKANQVAVDLNILRTNPSPFRTEAERIYLSNFDIANALIRIQEYERIRSEEKIAEQVEVAKEIEQAKEEAIEAYIPEQTEEPANNYIYSMTMTEAEQQTLEMYMDSVGIEWERL